MGDKLNERQQQILEWLNAEREVKISELKEAFGVTEMTIRRDLEKLEAAGNVKRTFGGGPFWSDGISRWPNATSRCRKRRFASANMRRR
ncbi:DeoR family transcriptional regulator [Cohnella laeviribosi]|uniref:DeoR family transcriptional regulator n=1 Tax=Cohnella laeviribosi TaxID=380174 RepID=UPI0003690758|nr:DeoR family transcriptional regulator [Cohnella laeviribosi]